MDKVGRNDPCPCGSGKKFKKCCENKSNHKKINAQVISPTSGLTSLFKRNVTAPPQKPSDPIDSK